MAALNILILAVIIIATLVILTASMISKKSSSDREKLSPFECGFDPFSSSRIPFSLRFFMITIVFLIFDVEIAILLPTPLIATMLPNNTWLLIMSVFMLTLILGLIHEWNFGSLDWSS